ncbi:4Fe-4S dicluster domain-containing protein [Planctomycetota bacterium]
MAIIIKKDKETQALIQRVQEISGVDLSTCYQCKKCTNGCPMAAIADCSPAEVIRQLHLQAGDELLDQEIVWACASCETCTNRCPMGIDGAAVMDALRKIAQEKKADKGNVPKFNRAFLKTVELFGRSYEIGMVMAYKLTTGSFLQDTEKFPTMLKKGKLAILPPRGADKATVKRIFKKTKDEK